MNNPSNSRPSIQIKPSITLQARTVIGSDSACDQQLHHPLVASKHVRITLHDGQAQLQDLGTGTFVNGSKVVGKSVKIVSGDQIDIGPYVFTFTGAQLEPFSSMNYAQLTVLGLGCKVKSGSKEHTLFDGITLVFRPGEFVCLLGPSGCGKSSLLNCLSGRTEPTSGTVQVNRRDLYSHFESLKKHIVVVAQKPLVHSSLTIDQAMRFTAALRLPLNSKPRERINTLLQNLHLDAIRKSRISKISGGEEKRFCLASELLSDPGLIFLDEVTSGLDENTDAELMSRFRKMAIEQRKTIVCVTHSLSNIPDTCHQVVILGKGGHLAFVGTPSDALAYFRVTKLADIYPMLVATDITPDAPLKLANRFRESKEYARYLDERLPEDQRVGAHELQNTRKVSPDSSPRINWLAETVITLSQTCVLSGRHGLLLAKDSLHWLSLTMQVVLVAFVLFFAFGSLGSMPDIDPVKEDELLGVLKLTEKKAEAKAREHGSTEEAQQEVVDGNKKIRERVDWLRNVLNFTFLVGVTSFWLGCNNAAREIVRERAIYQQEKNFNLRPLAYFFSKLSVLSLVVFCQVILLTQLAFRFCGPPESLSTHITTTLGALAFCGTTLGLMISAISKTESVAVSLIPIAVIPQIILSGAITKLAGTSGLGIVLAQIFVTNYWGRIWMNSCLDGKPHSFGIKESIGMLESGGIAGLPMIMILGHSILFCSITLLSLYSFNLLPNIKWKRQNS